MSAVSFVEEAEATERVRIIYADIKAAFGLAFVPNLFKAMAHNPGYLEATWYRIKAIMGPGALDRKTKEMVAVAVSAANNCTYCVKAHTAALRKLGAGDAEITELMAVVDLFNGLNSFADGLQVETDLEP